MPSPLAASVGGAQARLVHRAAVMGVNTLAAPVFDHRGVLVGSIAIVGSTQVIAPKPVAAQLGAVLDAARSVSRELGWKG